MHMKHLLKSNFLALFILLAILVSAQENNNRGYIVKTGEMAPNFVVTLENGEKFQLSEQKGKVVMLQFTASWCSVCRKEMPFIESEIWQKLKGEEFVLIGIDRDEPLEKLKLLSEQTGITYPLALDPGADVFGKFAHKKAGVTRNVIIDRNGKIIYLTRLFNRKEFDEMKKVIFNEVKAQ